MIPIRHLPNPPTNKLPLGVILYAIAGLAIFAVVAAVGCIEWKFN